MARFDGVDAAMTFLVVVWGTAFVAIRALAEVWSPWDILWFRYLPFIVGFGAWLVLTQRRRLTSLTGSDWLRYVVLGFLGVIGYHVPLNFALREGTGVTAATAAILVATVPLWTLFVGAALGREPLGPRRLAGSAAAFSGVIVVVLLGRGDAEFSVAAHASLALLGAFLWSLYSIVAKPLIARHGGLFLTALSFTVGTLFLVPYGFAVGIEPLRGLTALQLFWAAYLGILATLLGYVIWNFALARRRPSEVTSYIYGVPVVATLAGALLISEPVTPWFLLGAALVLGGVITIQQARARDERLAAAQPADAAGSAGSGADESRPPKSSP